METYNFDLIIEDMEKTNLITQINDSLQIDNLRIGEDTFFEPLIHEKINDNEEILIETICFDGVECTHYVHGIEQNTIKIPFESVSNENLHLLLENIEQANSFLENE